YKVERENLPFDLVIHSFNRNFARQRDAGAPPVRWIQTDKIVLIPIATSHNVCNLGPLDTGSVTVTHNERTAHAFRCLLLGDPTLPWNHFGICSRLRTHNR